MTFLLNYSRYVLLGIAMAFLINPYVYANGEYYADDGDEDRDRIHNEHDVCFKNSYALDEHIACLQKAGVAVLTTADAGKEAMEKRLELVWRNNGGYMEVERRGGDVKSYLHDAISWMGQLFYESLGVPVTNWEDLNIGTCMDLETYYKDQKRFSETLKKWSNRLDFKIPFIGRRDPTYSLRKAVSIVFGEYSIMYADAYADTKTAHAKLCGKDRLKKTEKGENPVQ